MCNQNEVVFIYMIIIQKLTHKLPNNLKVRILRVRIKLRSIRKISNFYVETYPSSQCSFINKTLAIIVKQYAKTETKVF